MNPNADSDNKRYLENTLQTAKMKLQNAKVEQRIAIAVFDNKQELLQEQIDSIERQLAKTKATNE